jgi:hypothetical protein
MNWVYMLGSSGQDGLVVDDRWVKLQKKQGLVCKIKGCDALMPDAAAHLQEVRVTRDYRGVFSSPSPKVHCTLVSGLVGGAVLSNRLVELIGRDRIRRSHFMVPILNTAGHLYPHVYLVARRKSGCLRGQRDSVPQLCRACGRFFYPAGPQKGYLLSRYWRTGMVFRLLEWEPYIDPTFFEEKVRPAKLSRLTTTKVSLAAAPEDGLPAPYEAMIKSIRNRV